MKNFNPIIAAFSVIICLTFCASKNQFQVSFPQKITTVYFQKWFGGRPESGSGTNFYIEFEKPLSKEIQLEKVYFQQQESPVEKLDKNRYVARFINPNNNINLTSDSENGAKPPEKSQPTFDLKPNEVIVEYRYKQTKRFYKISNVKEKQVIAYP